MKKNVALLYLLLSTLFVNSQAPQNADSLLQLLQTSKADTSKIIIYHNLFLAYRSIDLHKADSFAREGLHLSLKKGLKKDIANAYLNIGRLFANKNMNDSAIYYYKQSIAYAELIKNYEGIASNYVNIGNLYFVEADWPNALNYYNKGLAIAEEHNYYQRKITALSNIAGVYFNQKDYSRSKEFMLKALAINEKEDKENISITIIGGLANVYMALKDTPQALNYLNESMAFYKTENDSIGIAEALSNMATLQQNPNESIRELLTAQNIFDRINPDDLYAAINLGNLGKKYNEAATLETNHVSKIKLLSEAKKHLLRAIAQGTKLNLTNYNADFHEELSKVEEARGDYRSSLIHLQEAISLKDSLYSQEAKNEIAQKASQYDLSLRDKQIELNNLALKNSRNQRIGLIAGIGLLTIIGGLLYYQNRTRKRTNTTLLSLNNQLDEANKIKTKFFGILSHDLRSPIANLVNFLHIQKEAKDLISEEAAELHQQKITQSTELLLENMEAMLLWSKSQMEHFKPQEKVILVDDLFTYIRKSFAQDGLIQFSFSAPAGLTISSDEDYLKTILLNLTNNAVKALSNTKEPKIKWEAYRDNNQITLSITDNGPGVNTEDLKALHDADAPVSGKTGLGLHIIRDLAKAINCVIDVTKNPKESGTVFRLSI